MLLLQRKYRALLGLDITTSSVKLIELAMAGGQYRVEAYAAEPTPQNAINEKAIVDAEAVGEAIRRAVKRAGAKSNEVAVAISGDAAITKVIQMPRSLRSGDLEAQVEMQADQYIPFPMDEVSYDFEVLGANDKDPDSNDVLLVATRQPFVGIRSGPVDGDPTFSGCAADLDRAGACTARHGGTVARRDGWREFGCACASPAYMDPAPPGRYRTEWPSR